jgi:hypothetical protein
MKALRNFLYCTMITQTDIASFMVSLLHSAHIPHTCTAITNLTISFTARQQPGIWQLGKNNFDRFRLWL